MTNLYEGSDGQTSYLLTVWPDGSHEIATRPVGSGATWSPPVTLAEVAS